MTLEKPESVTIFNRYPNPRFEGPNLPLGGLLSDEWGVTGGKSLYVEPEIQKFAPSSIGYDSTQLIAEPDPIVQYFQDSFARVVTNGWGMPEVGGGYVLSPALSRFSTNGTQGVIDVGGTIGFITPQSRNFSMKGQLTFDRIPVGGNFGVRLILRKFDEIDSPYDDYHARMTLTPEGFLTLSISQANVRHIVDPVLWGEFEANKIYHFRTEIEEVIETRGRVKVWEDGELEPVDWTIDAVIDGIPTNLQASSTPGMVVSQGSGMSNGPMVVTVDNLDITNRREDTVHPNRGNISSLSSLNPSQNSISVGIMRRRGSTVQVRLHTAAKNHISTSTATFEPGGWGNVRFSSLTPGTKYYIDVLVDGVKQVDRELEVSTLSNSNNSFRVIAGSCQFTGSNHPTLGRMSEKGAAFISHMGDLHYMDSYSELGWREGCEKSMATPRMQQLLSNTPMVWTMDNHDRIIVNEVGPGTGLNLGTTNPRTQELWKALAGDSSYPTDDTLGLTWTMGDVRFIQTDMWSERQDADGDPSPRKCLGDQQLTWFKSVLGSATEKIVVWFCSWTARNHANGRWNSFPEEFTDLENFVNDRPSLKDRLILVGGDSHSLQADSGARVDVPGATFRFHGVPSLNCSGFNRSSSSGDGAPEGAWDIANESIRPEGQSESYWGGYSLMEFTPSGSQIHFNWKAIVVGPDGHEEIRAEFDRTY